MFDKLVDLLIQFIKLFQFWEVLEPYQGGVRLRLGKFHTVLGPGLSWMIPLGVDKALTENVVTETLHIRPQSLTTRDGKQIVVSSIVTFHVDDIKVFLLEVEGRNDIIKDASCGVVSEFVMKHTWRELNDFADVGNELAKAVRRKAKAYGVNIHSVQLADFTETRSFRLIQW